jgi:UDP-GlcNAc:undecaprenyl-phosphate GlcNAc-1-phosphate transferase
MNYLYGLISFGLCLAFTPAVRQLARQRGWLAFPKKDRWHKKPTALMGGLAIFASLMLPLLYVAEYRHLLPFLSHTQLPVELPPIGVIIVIGATSLFALGLIDDLIHIKPHTKLVGQILVAAMAAFMGFRLHWFASLTVDTMVTIFWIVGITNAFNLLDNMDGLCAGIGAIAALFLAVLFEPAFPEAARIAFVLCGALAGFLFYNFNPASIFMGDCGSLVIGYILAVLSLYYSETGLSTGIALYAVPILIMMVAIFDTSLVTAIRILSGRKASTGGRDHTSHRLVIMGFTEKGAVLFLYGIAAVAGVSAWLVSTADKLTSPAVILPVAVAFLLMGIYLSQLRVYEEKEFSVLRGHRYTPILLELTYKRQLLLVLLDLGLIAFAYYLAYRLRFETIEFARYFNVFLSSLPAIIICKFIAFFAMGVYRGIWRHMSTDDVVVYMKASLLGSVLSVVVITFLYRFQYFSKGIFIIDCLLTTAFLLGTRGSFRMFLDTMKRKTTAGENVLIYGAGQGGELLLRELLNNQKIRLRPLGFIDDDPLKTGKKILGYPIMGSFRDAEQLIAKHQVTGLLISFKNEDVAKFVHLRKLCRDKDLFLKQLAIKIDDVELEL